MLTVNRVPRKVLICFATILFLFLHSYTYGINAAASALLNRNSLINDKDENEVIYANNFNFRERALFFTVEQLPASYKPFVYRVVLQYNKLNPLLKSTSLAGGCSAIAGSDTLGIVRVCSHLIKLDREVIVSSLVNSLATMKISSDLGNDSLIVPKNNKAIIQELSNKLRDEFELLQQGQIKLFGAPVAGLIMAYASVPVEDISRKRIFSVKNEKNAPKSFLDSVQIKANRYGVKVNNIIADSNLDFLVDSLQIEIEDGNIINLNALGSINGKPLVFYNESPIGISNRTNISKWQNLYLVCPGSEKQRFYAMNLYKAMQYIPNLSSKSDDWSPMDGVYIIKPNSPRVNRTMFKSPTNKILQARIFTDVVGLDNDRPNGLIQLELEKKIIINNNSPSIKDYLRVSLFKYIKPSVVLSKLEDKNKALVLKRNITSQFPLDRRPVVRFDAIDAISHTNSSIGLELNIGTYHLPAFKTYLSANYEARLNRILLIDSVFNTHSAGMNLMTDQSNASLFASSIVFKAGFRPDSRYGLDLKYARTSHSSLSENSEIYRISPSSLGQTSSYELMGWASIASNGEIFVRSQLTELYKKEEKTKSFFQFQIGYQFDVFSKNRDKPAIKQLL
jgi:hypothetical protein